MDDLGLLRARTADLRCRVEDAVDLPCSARSRDDYVALLGRSHSLHALLGRRLAPPGWSSCWAELGIEVGQHRRASLLEDDLRRLGAPGVTPDAQVRSLDVFGEALGRLDVLEGSGIGGRVLAPALRAAVGDVPTRSLAGDVRLRVRAWQAVRAALRRAEDARTDDVVRGARAVFAAFGFHLPVPAAVGRLAVP